MLRTDPAEQTAILAWLVQGCLEWQRRGLDVPECVRNYTEEWRSENDPLADWIADECQLSADHWTLAKDLRGAYERWCEENSIKPISTGQSWGSGLKAHGCTEKRGAHGKRGWAGIGLRVTGDAK